MLVLSLFAGCAPVQRFPGPLAGMGREIAPAHVEKEPPAAPLPKPRKPPPSPGDGIALAAAGFLGDSSLVVDGKKYRWDCSGLVEASLSSAGCSWKGSSGDLFVDAKEARVLHRKRIPHPGDIAFFDDTWDKNGNGRRDDALTHVAVVESVDPDGTIHLVHLGSHGVARIVMNLRHPDEREDESGKRINDYLRIKKAGDSPRTRYLAGELWVAFASYWDADVPDQVSDRSSR